MAREFRGGARRMQKTWTGITFNETAVGTTQAIMGAISIAASTAQTVLRMRGVVLIKGTPDALADDDTVGLGIGIFSTDAVAVGGVSLPEPLGDANTDWLWHQYVPLLAGQAALLGQDIGSIVRVEIDSKAMRRMKANQSLVLMAIRSPGNYAACVLNGGLRVLLGEL